MGRRRSGFGLWAAQSKALEWAVITVFLPAIAVLVALIPLRSFLQANLHQAISFRDLTEDPNELYGHSYYGLLSSLGVLLWWTAGLTGVFSYVVLRRLRRSPETARYLLCLGLLTAWMGLDDLYQIHEHMQLLHIPRLGTYAIYAIVASGILLRFRAVVAKTPYLIAAVAIIGFALHNWLDVFRPPEDVALWRHAWLGGHFWEDGAKFLGIAGWLAYISRVAHLSLPSETEAGETLDQLAPPGESLAYQSGERSREWTAASSPSSTDGEDPG